MFSTCTRLFLTCSLGRGEKENTRVMSLWTRTTLTHFCRTRRHRWFSK